ncbi:elongation factor 1-delta [Sarotherodon galilaeus]
MIGRLVSLILLSTLSVTEMNEVPQQISLTVAKLGDNVTLTCDLSGSDTKLFYWFKLNFGYMIQTVTKGTYEKMSLNGQFNNSRFSATKVGKMLSLNIRNVSKEDEATYFCQAGSSQSISFINGTIVAVNDPKTQQKSNTMKQTPAVESVRLSEPKTLQCSFLSKDENGKHQSPNEDKVHWFKGVSESHPGIIYHGSIKNKEDRRCDYSLSKTITNSPDAGMDYCALVTCGEILFGKRTKVEIVIWSMVMVYLNICAFCCILLLESFYRCVPTIGASHSSASLGKSMSGCWREGEEVELNYVALDFPSRKSSRLKSKKESPECTIYSGIREGQ